MTETAGYTDEQIKELTKGATQGYWDVGRLGCVIDPAGIFVAMVCNFGDDERSTANANFIAASRTLLPALLERAQRAEARIANVRAALNAQIAHCDSERLDVPSWVYTVAAALGGVE